MGKQLSLVQVIWSLCDGPSGQRQPSFRTSEIHIFFPFGYSWLWDLPASVFQLVNTPGNYPLLFWFCLFRLLRKKSEVSILISMGKRKVKTQVNGTRRISPSRILTILFSVTEKLFQSRRKGTQVDSRLLVYISISIGSQWPKITMIYFLFSLLIKSIADHLWLLQWDLMWKELS